jgi:CBS domain-containing protein
VLHAFPPDINPFAINAAESIAAIAAVADRVRLTAADLMAREPRTTTPDAPLESAARQMRDHKIGALPVLSNFALVGLITESDIFRAMVEVFETNDRAVRITFSLKSGEDVLPLVAEIARKRALRVSSFMSLPRHDPPVCVVQLVGAKLDEALDDVWKSQHRVINVVQLGEDKT